ncbi:MAG: Carboxypeptidase T [Calditrichaeota bacterium]|nr:Carboxypeptidase T [Calditrichota bacterium]
MRAALLALIAVLPAVTVTAQPPDSYHDLDETYDALYELEAQYPDVIKIDSVGHSQKDHEPILLVKISENVHIDEDEPTVLIVGHIHGEEILGNEITLRVIEELASDMHPEFRYRRENLEMYFIPTMNPEGMKVVFGDPDDPDLIWGPDVTYRKNKRDNLGDGVFRYQVGWGNDTSGVDLNRNFALNFFHGDTLFHLVDETEPYDYYRGPGPFSEAETQVVRDLHYDLQPLYGITFHSSRSGSFSEKVFYPWDWNEGDELKMAPDQDVLDDVATSFAERISSLSGGTYIPLRSAGRNAKMHDWTYAAAGWMNLECEVGNQNIQPSEQIMEQVIEDVKPGVYYLLDRAYGSDELDTPSGYLEIRAQDESGQPLAAEVLIPDRVNGYIRPRYTDPQFGVHRRALLEGNYTVVTRAWGYVPDTSVVNVGTHGPAPYTITLERKPHNTVHLRALDATTQEPVPATFIVHRSFDSDTMFVAGGDASELWPRGAYTVETWSPGYIPRAVSFEVEGPHLMEVSLVEPDGAIIDDFESGVPERWTNSGDFSWLRSGLEAYESVASLKSAPDQFYEPEMEGAATVAYEIPAGVESLALTGRVRYELEPDYDFCYVEFSADNGPWTALDTLNGFSAWRRFLYDFREFRDAETVRVRWTVASDEMEEDRGVFLDDVELSWSSIWVSAPEQGARPLTWALHPAHPNPFNPSTRLEFELAEATEVTLAVYDILGREAATVVAGRLEAGPHARTLNLAGHASGVYFVRLDAGEFQRTRKVLLIR